MKVWSGKLDCIFHGEMHWELNKELWFLSREANKHHQFWKEMGVKVSQSRKMKGYSKVFVPKGYDTDLASIPRIGWALVAPWDVARAAIIHDVLYGALRLALKNKTHDAKLVGEMRAAADKVFLEGMHHVEPSIPNWKANTCYWSVRPFGGFAIRKRAKVEQV